MARTRGSRNLSAKPDGSNGIGHNSDPIDRESLRSYVSRAAAVMHEQKELADKLKEICAEADEAGTATKREVRRLAREALMEPDVLRSQLDRMETLRQVLGELATTPLGQAAQERAGAALG